MGWRRVRSARFADFVRSAMSLRSFRERSVEVQHEWIGVASEFGNHEWDALRHQPRDERDVARDPIELLYEHAAFRCSSDGQGRGELSAQLPPCD
jgi:hypothetical protein